MKRHGPGEDRVPENDSAKNRPMLVTSGALSPDNERPLQWRSVLSGAGRRAEA